MARNVVPRAGGEQTRARILAVSERLFSELGYDGVSMRQVGTAAEVPFALVTYHFKTKLGLYQAVFNRRISEFSEQRIAQLQQVVIGPDARANFLAISAAFVKPMMGLRQLPDGAQFSQLLAREVFDPKEADRGVLAEHLDPGARLTIDLLHMAAPNASRADVARAYHFTTGALAVNHASSERLKRISGLDGKTLDSGDGTDQLVRFIAAGLLAALRPELLANALDQGDTHKRKRTALADGKERTAPVKKARSATNKRSMATAT